MMYKRLMVFFCFIGVLDFKNFFLEVDYSNLVLGLVECVMSYIEKIKLNYIWEFFLFLFVFSFG